MFNLIFYNNIAMGNVLEFYSGFMKIHKKYIELYNTFLWINLNVLLLLLPWEEHSTLIYFCHDFFKLSNAVIRFQNLKQNIFNIC